MARYGGFVKLVVVQGGHDEPFETQGSLILTNHRLLFKSVRPLPSVMLGSLKQSSASREWSDDDTLAIPIFSVTEARYYGVIPVCSYSASS